MVDESEEGESEKWVCRCVWQRAQANGHHTQRRGCGTYVNLIFLIALSQVSGDTTVADIRQHDHIVYADATRKTERLEAENRITKKKG